MKFICVLCLLINLNIQAKHPSALDRFDEMMGFAEGKNIAVFLDYDGTLSKIVADPDKAFMSQKVNNFIIINSKMFF